MTKKTIILITASIIIIVLLLAIFLRFSEDTWIKDEKGIFIKHGSPSSIPAQVREQQEAITCASQLYADSLTLYANLESQCLGRCNFYSVDIVHVPRTEQDNLEQNQCSDYKNQVTKYFIELNSQGQIVRVR